MVQESEAALQSILEAAESVAMQINAIAVATEEQSASSEMIRRSTADIKDMATKTMDASLNSEKAITILETIRADLNAVIESMQTKEKA
jgi:methyl-accepting chemotaxis protein